MLKCKNCPRNCNVDRKNKIGMCGVGDDIKIARASLHFGEEPCISGTRGSGTVFFSGCPLKCVMCQNFEISHNCFGKYISIDRFIEIMQELENLGAHNINLVSPTHYFRQISLALEQFRPKIPIVYNSSGYENIENITEDIFDIYLFDLKYFSREKSERYSKCSDYFSKASAAIKTAVDMVGEPVFDEQGILRRGVIVRHLILPQCTNDAIEVIDWLNRYTPNIIFSLMSQYVPMYKTEEFPEINRKITKREYNKVLNHCFENNFSKIYIQELSSATSEFIPEFDLTGL